MDITEIPFNKFLNISKSGQNDSGLTLVFDNHLKNHLGTFHAGAQYVLAEACSGHTLYILFPDLYDQVIPVLRTSKTKFKKPATSDIHATASIKEDIKEKFEQQLQKKGRATIAVEVDVYDTNDIKTMSGIFEWFVQKI
jgi:acyl-coenzyme A thioesterase PaaI-like protein